MEDMSVFQLPPPLLQFFKVLSYCPILSVKVNYGNTQLDTYKISNMYIHMCMSISILCRHPVTVVVPTYKTTSFSPVSIRRWFDSIVV